MIDNPDYKNCESLKCRAIKLRDEMYKNLQKNTYGLYYVDKEMINNIFDENDINKESISNALSGFSNKNEEQKTENEKTNQEEIDNNIEKILYKKQIMM